MSRKTIELDKSLVEKIIADLESKKDYENRSSLYDDVVAELVKNHGYKPFSSATIYLRVKTWGIEPKTKGGKRGNLTGNIDALKKWREGGGESTQRKVDDTTPLIQFFTSFEKGKYLKLAKAIKRGSIKAAVKLKCLECANYQIEEIKHCQCFDCPLYPIRPYKIVQIE